MGSLPSNLHAGIFTGNSALEPILELTWLKRNQAPTYIERRYVILHYCRERCLMLESCTIRYGKVHSQSSQESTKKQSIGENRRKRSTSLTVWYKRFRTIVKQLANNLNEMGGLYRPYDYYLAMRILYNKIKITIVFKQKTNYSLVKLKLFRMKCDPLIINFMQPMLHIVSHYSC